MFQIPFCLHMIFHRYLKYLINDFTLQLPLVFYFIEILLLKCWTIYFLVFRASSSIFYVFILVYSFFSWNIHFMIWMNIYDHFPLANLNKNSNSDKRRELTKEKPICKLVRNINLFRYILAFIYNKRNLRLIFVFYWFIIFNSWVIIHFMSL